MSYGEMRDYEEREGMVYLTYLDGSGSLFAPKGLTVSQLDSIALELRGTPPEEKVVKAALYELWLTTKHEKMNEADRAALLSVYARRLSEYPSDVVAHVIQAKIDSATFFPAWAELRADLDSFTGWRARLLGGMRKFRERLTKP